MRQEDRVAVIVEEARRRAGLTDFGDEGFREGLGVLLQVYAAAGFTDAGVSNRRDRILHLLTTRLRVIDALRRHPEIRDREIREPVFLTGLPRTGTSALFNLLAADPAARPLLLWEGIFPDPAEGLEPGEADPRYVAFKAGAERLRRSDPEGEKIHFANADTPEECVLLLAQDFCDVQLGIEVLLEPYASWFQRQDLRRPYAHYRDLLKLLDWQRPGERWLLKSPAHLWALDVLVEMFPDACILMTHRNPIECIGSYCSMIAKLMGDRRDLDETALGPMVLEYLARSLERGLAAREKCDPARFFDVDFRAFGGDPLQTVSEIYARFGLNLSPDTFGILRRHVAGNPKGRHGRHRYELGSYGLTPEAVAARLEDYIARFGLSAE
jgi:hypothetical protein